MTEVMCPNCGTRRDIKGIEERVRCANKESCGMRFYVKNNIVPEKKDVKGQKGTTTKYSTSIVNRPSKIQIKIDDVNWLTVLKIMDRGISTIRNKSEVKQQKGAYYFDFLEWTREFKKIEAIGAVMKLLGEDKG